MNNNKKSTLTPSDSDFRSYEWYSQADRALAEDILKKLNYYNRWQTLFMVRHNQYSNRQHDKTISDYAISIINNGFIQHIIIYQIEILNSADPTKIHSNSNPKKSFSLNQKQYFDSIVDLVNYYRKHSLGEALPMLNTLLGVPFKQTIRTWIIMDIAKNIPKSWRPNNIVEVF